MLLDYVPLAGSAIIGLVWAIRLEGRVNVQQQAFIDLKELINTRFDNMGERLGRIERSLNGNLRDH